MACYGMSQRHHLQIPCKCAIVDSNKALNWSFQEFAGIRRQGKIRLEIDLKLALAKLMKSFSEKLAESLWHMGLAALECSV